MEYLSLALLGIIIVISPGADFILVLRNSLNEGRKAGIYTAIGIGLAISIHIAYSLLGIGYLISQNKHLLTFIQFAGSGYLIFIGFKGLFAKQEKLEIATSRRAQKTSFHTYITQGLFCNLLNPKTVLFFLSMFSQIIPSNGQALTLPVLYGGYMIALHLAWFCLVAMLFTSNKLQTLLSNAKLTIERTCGAALIIFGCALGLNS